MERRRVGRGRYFYLEPEHAPNPAFAARMDPAIWRKAKADALAESDGVMSPRVMQAAVKLYLARGGSYRGVRTGQEALSRWGEEKWRLRPGTPKGTGGRGRYLPKAAWAELDVGAAKETDDVKRKACDHVRGPCVVDNTPEAEEAAKRVRIRLGRVFGRVGGGAGATLTFFHGAHRWTGLSREPVASKSRKSAEHGPGLYLTTNPATARKYAKGGGVVVKFDVDANLRLLGDARLSAREMVAFVRGVPRLRNREAIVADIERASERMKRDDIPAAVLLNLMHYYGTAFGEPGLAALRFYLSHGIDGDIVTGVGEGGDGGRHHEQWLVLYNLDKVRAYAKAKV